MSQKPLRILVIGAGVIGSVYAARLQAAGHPVTLLARGKHAADLRARGLLLEDASTGQATTSHVRIVESLAPDDVYDLALACVRLDRARDRRLGAVGVGHRDGAGVSSPGRLGDRVGRNACAF